MDEIMAKVEEFKYNEVLKEENVEDAEIYFKGEDHLFLLT